MPKATDKPAKEGGEQKPQENPTPTAGADSDQSSKAGDRAEPPAPPVPTPAVPPIDPPPPAPQPPAPPVPTPPVAAQAPTERIPSDRVCCLMPNPADCIDDVVFASVSLGGLRGKTIHVSERLPKEKMAHFLRLPSMFVPFEYEQFEDSAERQIEDALMAARAQAGSSSAAAVQHDMQNQLDDQQRANLAQSGEIKRLNERLEVLQRENAHLRSENDALKATGVRA